MGDEQHSGEDGRGSKAPGARRPVRIAACVTGLLRTWRFASPSVLSAVLLARPDDVLETFLHFGSPNVSHVGAVRAALPPGVHVSRYSGVEHASYRVAPMNRRNSLNLAVGNALAFERVVAREHEVGARFDWVVRMRTDDVVHFQVMLNLPPPSDERVYSNWLGGCHDTNVPRLCVKDTFAVLTRGAAATYYEGFLRSYADNGFARLIRSWRSPSWCPECRLGIVLRAANVSVHLIPRSVVLLRAADVARRRQQLRNDTALIGELSRAATRRADAVLCANLTGIVAGAPSAIGAPAIAGAACARAANVFIIPDDDGVPRKVVATLGAGALVGRTCRAANVASRERTCPLDRG
ncbi:hypothetical protein KFE25_013714 [Diacronema lutheri]|uniref:Uncharacterized protein n=1 Tax=Diacronema lutheri TaxID=2081491 RepID=A0A8J5XTH5_DIALT|nr:hypothetical protein KFE25_013714 [Diacronema lutheri]